MTNSNVTFANQYGQQLAALEIGKKWVSDYNARYEQILENLDYQINEVLENEGQDVEDLAYEIFNLSFSYNVGKLRFKNAGMELNENLISVGNQLSELLSTTK